MTTTALEMVQKLICMLLFYFHHQIKASKIAIINCSDYLLSVFTLFNVPN